MSNMKSLSFGEVHNQTLQKIKSAVIQYNRYTILYLELHQNIIIPKTRKILGENAEEIEYPVIFQ